MTKLKSMDVTLGDVTRSFEFDPPIEVSSSDEGEASLEVLRDGETTEVVLVGGFDEATVSVSYSIEFNGSTNVQLSDVSGFDSYDDIREAIERGDMDDVNEAIREDIERNLEADNASIDSVDDLEVTDENGDVVDE